ncbi:hypothetical protein [Microbacterium natoriense]|uniref:hypothetical protein n=1 Tax=Microbacterium natoriense TaxID=284570 RepID=UPI0031E2C3D7
MGTRAMGRRRGFVLLAAGLLSAGLVLSGVIPASAAPGHQNTDPYNTGCAQSKRLVSSKNAMGGTLSVWESTACGTNWTEWYGPRTKVAKYIWTVGAANGYTTAQFDTAGWSYSMQTYAPGTAVVQGTFVFDGNPITFRCGTGCQWW